MNYGKLIDNNNVGLKQTLKKILKDVDKRIETSENKECDTTEYETQIQELTEENETLNNALDELAEEVDTLSDELETYKPKTTEITHTDKVDIQEATFNTISYGNDPTFGGYIEIFLNGEIGDSSVDFYKNIFKQNLDVNNIQINNQPITISGALNIDGRYISDAGYKDMKIGVSVSNDTTLTLSSENTIKATIVNKETQATHEITGTFPDGTGNINITTNSS